MPSFTTNPQAYLVDIDGTLADCTHRLKHINNGKKDWDAFFAACGKDTPILHIIQMVAGLQGRAAIVLVSGRPERTRRDTIEWLHQHGVKFDALYMRKDGDRRPDNIVKRELLDVLRADGWEPIMVFDDRDQVVAMWREAGIPCAQVAPGNF